MLTKRELFRQILHLMIGLLTAITYYLDIISSLTVFLMIIVGILSSILVKRIRLPFFSLFLDNFEREDLIEKFPGRGMIFFFIGVLLVMKLFEKDIALASIMILSLGDSISHIIGERFGQIKNIFNGKSKKLFEGTLAGTLVGFLGASLFVPWTHALIASFVAMTAEVIEIDLNHNSVDDNLTVPLVAGTVLYILSKFIV
ncbi:hypothetical protein HYX11_00390 [Candidatus Woesearchaeota archaeon]|nr:hypothetical protein [Candidatus Woesearchaeota archaeon]